MKRKLAVCCLISALPLCAGALELVREGRALAQIVVAPEALPQVKFAAEELRDHIFKIAGAELEIVAEPADGMVPVYVGKSEYTDKLALQFRTDEKEWYRVTVRPDCVVLAGYDATFPFYPHGYTDASQRESLLAEWQQYAGAKWDFPFMDLFDPRHYNKELGFSLFDPSGSLYAVYDFLERLGVRWYMPDEELGVVLPEMADIAVAETDETREPVFDWRFLRVGWAGNTANMKWYKRNKVGVSEMVWISHGTPRVTRFLREEHPEYFAMVGAGRELPRLAPPLRDAMIRYAGKFFARYPELRHASVAPADAFTSIDERDAAAGWRREERGQRGRLSDYVWTFVDQVAAGLVDDYPDKIVMGLAYSYYREPPQDFDRFQPNVGVAYCQTRAEMRDPQKRQDLFAERERWLEMLPSKEFFVWEYFLWHRKDRSLWGVPVVFTKLQQEDMLALAGKSRGEYVEAWTLQGGGPWGLNHLTVCLQARLYWTPDLDLDAWMEDYCRKFFGPAAGQMREFYEFAEEVWMRPGSRTISLAGGFLKREDVVRFFSILDSARESAGEGLYARRIAMIREECEPMARLHDNLKRVGPDFTVPLADGEPETDGRLDESFWREASGAWREPCLVMRDLHSGEPVSPGTKVLLRWSKAKDGLFVAVFCEEPEMARLDPGIDVPDSVSIYDGDFVEIFLEPGGRAPFKIVVNPRGTILTEATDSEVEPGGVGWNPELDVATSLETDGWSVEMFVPRKSLDGAEPLEAEKPWGINVCRSRFVTGKAENSAIAPTGGRFFTPTKFGNLIAK